MFRSEKLKTDKSCMLMVIMVTVSNVGIYVKKVVVDCEQKWRGGNDSEQKW